MRGVRFGSIHSYYDLGLVLSKADVQPAREQSSYVEVRGRNGKVDLTEAMGRVSYDSREITLTFTVMPGDNWDDKQREVCAAIGGKRFGMIVLDRDPDYYWEGRCSVDSYASDRNVNKIVVVVTADPFRYRLEQARVVFEPGTAVSRTLENRGAISVVPTVTATADATVSFGGAIHSIKAGTHKVLDLELGSGAYEVSVTSSGTTTFEYREGDL